MSNLPIPPAILRCRCCRRASIVWHRSANFQPQELQQIELARSPVGWISIFVCARSAMLGEQASTGQRRLFCRARNHRHVFRTRRRTPARSGSFEATRGVESSFESSLSTVVDQQLITNLPLNGRDVYALLALQPGVTAAQERRADWDSR